MGTPDYAVANEIYQKITESRPPVNLARLSLRGRAGCG